MVPNQQLRQTVLVDRESHQERITPVRIIAFPPPNSLEAKSVVQSNSSGVLDPNFKHCSASTYASTSLLLDMPVWAANSMLYCLKTQVDAIYELSIK